MTETSITPLTQIIKSLCQQGYDLYDAGDHKSALRVFYQAWLKIPKPQHEHAEAGWVLTAIGDTYFALGQFIQGTESLQSALCCPQQFSTGFIHFRLGQCLLNNGELNKARSALFQAYQEEGIERFQQADPRYLDSIRDLIPAPSDQ